METHSSCTSKIFIKDISELCKKCPLVELTKGYIKNQILFQALERKEILTPEQFNKYVDAEIENASKAMEKSYLVEKQLNDQTYRKKRIEIYILNKERIKALRKLAYPVIEEKNTSSTLHNHIFCNNGFELFEYLLENHIGKIDKRGRYSDIAYYYWRMYEDKYIIQRPQEFINWFSETYQDVIGKLKTKAEVENPNRKKHYTTSLDYFKKSS